uniref:Major facilitator superfamily domain-containing protein 12-like n=1 Tax=Phallusia mammillata TaxID=59560 RepID=A0A6F9DK04_9ASCI|nr:major facilitator superfamily domain-containing protein 12-like [Phallusia mammillata]
MNRELKKREKLCYGVGHVLNDLCASMWFSYLLVFFHEILEFSNSMAGNILLVGQLADGIATPFVGFESDRSDISCKYGRRKSWHLVGSVSVALTFPLLYMQCIGCGQNTPEYAQFIYYAPLVVIFQFGWAATQINHLALIPDLTHDDGERVTLNAIRYTFTVVSSIFVYGVAWGVLGLPSSPSSKNSELSPADAPAFRTLVLIVVGTGILFSSIFHLGLKEGPSRRHSFIEPEDFCTENCESKGQVVPDENTQLIHGPDENTPLIQGRDENTPIIQIKTPEITTIACSINHWYDWFKKPMFYQTAMLYMCTRLVVNLSQVYIPMYLTDTLKLHKQYIAVVPLVVYLSGFLAAVLVRPVTSFISQEVVYFFGGLLVLGACIWAHFIPMNSFMVFGMAVFLGMGTSIILVMSLSMTAKLIGKATTTGAFVYGAMSLTDKVSNGVAVVIIQNLNPCLCECNRCAVFFRGVMSYVIGAIMVLALISLFTIKFTKKIKPSSQIENIQQHNGSDDQQSE